MALLTIAKDFIAGFRMGGLAAGLPLHLLGCCHLTKLRQSGGSPGCPQCTSPTCVHLNHCSFNWGHPEPSDNATQCLQLATSTASEETGTFHLLTSVIWGRGLVHAVQIHPAQQEPGARGCVSRAKASCPQPCASSCSFAENNTSLPGGTLSAIDNQEATENSDL